MVLTLAGEVRSGHAKNDSETRIEIEAELAAALDAAIQAINNLAYSADRLLDESMVFSSDLACPKDHIIFFGIRVLAGPQEPFLEAFLGIRGTGAEIEIRFEDPSLLSQVGSFIRHQMAA